MFVQFIRQINRVPVMKSFAVYEEIKKSLMRGKWNFGEKIPVNDLIEEFKVSRRPVMDALKMLENEGYIEIIPQSGCKVVDYVKSEVLDQLMTSAGLEAFSAGLAAVNHTDAEMEELEALQANIRKDSGKLADKYFYFEYNQQFHYQIAVMTHSKKLLKLAMQMWDLNDFFLLNLVDHMKFDVMEQVEFHDRIMAHVKARDKANAAKAMEEHFQSYINKLQEHLP